MLSEPRESHRNDNDGMTESPAGHSRVTADSAPRKRIRARYASQACDSCRVSKLKCNGQSPCERCLRHRTQCQYSQSRTRDSVHENNVRPRRTTEERFAAIEARLDVLDASRRPRDASASASQGKEPGLHEDSRQGLDRSGPPSVTARAMMRLGSREVPFLHPCEYERYLKFFFEDINPCHPCVNEADFRERSRKFRPDSMIGKENTCFLALNYILFACADVLQDVGHAESGGRAPGWNWYLAADDLVNRIKISGRPDISLIQFLIYEAFYLMHADKPNAAYNTIGLACRRCYQMGLHQSGQSDEYSEHMKQRIFWTVYFVDRRISLSVGRPYGIRDTDISIPEPLFLDDGEVRPQQPLPDPDPNNSSIPYLRSSIAFARFAGEIWDKVFAAGVKQHDAVAIVLLDAKIKHWVEATLPSLSLKSSEQEQSRRRRWQYCLVLTRFNHLRLLLQRREMVSMQFTKQQGATCGELACDIVNRIAQHNDEIAQASSARFHMAVSLAGALLVLATLVVRDLSEIDLTKERQTYIDAYQEGLAMLQALSEHLASAQRLLHDLSSVTEAVRMKLFENAHNSTVNAVIEDPYMLFPYGEIDFAQQNLNWNDPMFSQEPSDFIDTANGLDLISPGNWEDVFDSNITGYGAPWL